MANEEALRTARDAVTSQLDAIFSMNVKDAAVRQNLGEINFQSAIPAIDRTLGLLEILREASLDFVSHQSLSNLKQTLDDITNHFKQIEAFTLNVNNPSGQRDQIVNNLEAHYNSWFERVYPVIGFAIRSSTDFSALERDLRSKIAQAEVTSKELLEQQQKAAVQAQETLSAIQRAAAEAGVSQEAVHFKGEADEHESVALKWFWATSGMAVLTVLWGLSLLWLLPTSDSLTTAQLVRQTLGKLVVLSGLYYGLIWCARNYNASRHNFVVNRHRQNALSTFETFVKAAGADDVKEAVLLQATSSIFSAQQSGYGSRDGESEQPSKLIEILRSIPTAPRS